MAAALGYSTVASLNPLSLSAQPHQKSPPPPPSPHLMIRRRLREPVLMAALDPLPSTTQKVLAREQIITIRGSSSPVRPRPRDHHRYKYPNNRPDSELSQSPAFFLLALIVCKDRAQGLVFKQRPKADSSLVSHSLFCLCLCTQHLQLFSPFDIHFPSSNHL